MWPLSYSTERVGMMDRASSSGKGAVAAIEEKIGTMVRPRPGQRPPVKPLVAIKTFSARTSARGVLMRHHPPSRDIEIAGVWPQILAPRAIAAFASPRA